MFIYDAVPFSCGDDRVKGVQTLDGIREKLRITRFILSKGPKNNEKEQDRKLEGRLHTRDGGEVRKSRVRGRRETGRGAAAELATPGQQYACTCGSVTAGPGWK